MSFDVDPDRQATARGYLERAGVADRVDLRLQPALDGLEDLDGVYDLAFLDAIKSEYAAYTELVLPLLRPGGLLIIDNSLMAATSRPASPSRAAGARTTSTRCAS